MNFTFRLKRVCLNLYKKLFTIYFVMKTTLAIGILFLLAVVWAAMHDIIKGAENLTNEYIAVFISAILLPLLIYLLVRRFSGAQK